MSKVEAVPSVQLELQFKNAAREELAEVTDEFHDLESPVWEVDLDSADICEDEVEMEFDDE